MMRDPQADPGRRAWLPCVSCGSTTPLYLLHCEVNLVWVQCNHCLQRWWHDTGIGHPRYPQQLFDVAQFGWFTGISGNSSALPDLL